MGEVIQFRRSKKAQKGKVLGMCQHGFHQWEVWKEKQFDVQEGKLVTVYRCDRCGTQKVEAH